MKLIITVMISLWVKYPANILILINFNPYCWTISKVGIFWDIDFFGYTPVQHPVFQMGPLLKCICPLIQIYDMPLR